MQNPLKENKMLGKTIKIIVFLHPTMESVAQLVRASVCGTEGRGFETPRSPTEPTSKSCRFFVNVPYAN